MLDPQFIKLIGYAAAALTTLSFVPQAVLTIRTQDTKSISLGMYLMFFIGVLLWLLYGIYIKDTAVIAANIVTAMLAFVILAIKIVNIRR